MNWENESIKKGEGGDNVYVCVYVGVCVCVWVCVWVSVGNSAPLFGCLCVTRWQPNYLFFQRKYFLNSEIVLRSCHLGKRMRLLGMLGDNKNDFRGVGIKFLGPHNVDSCRETQKRILIWAWKVFLSSFLLLLKNIFLAHMKRQQTSGWLSLLSRSGQQLVAFYSSMLFDVGSVWRNYFKNRFSICFHRFTVVHF